MMVISNGQPASVIWDYDRVELIADGVVHAIGVSLGVVGAIVIVVVAANSAHAANMPSIVISCGQNIGLRLLSLRSRI